MNEYCLLRTDVPSGSDDDASLGSNASIELVDEYDGFTHELDMPDKEDTTTSNIFQYEVRRWWNY